MDSRYELFCKEIIDGRYETLLYGNKYIFVHGDSHLMRSYKGFVKWYSKMVKSIEKTFLRSIIYEFIHVLELLGFFISKKQMVNSKIGKKMNEKFIRIFGENQNAWVIFSHTHTSMVDMQRRFANTGCIIYGIACYLEINEEGIKAIQEEY